MSDEAERAYWQARLDRYRADGSCERELMTALAIPAQSRAWSDEDVERAARAQWAATVGEGVAPWEDEGPAMIKWRAHKIAAMRAALATLPARPLAAAVRATPRRGIYVASRASVLARGEMWRRFRAEGHPIISTWIDEDGPNDTANLDELWVRIRREVVGAERLVLYVEPDDFPLKGAFVEIGMALAANVPIFIVAPGVEISGRNQRPFGSWIKYPSVTMCSDMAGALANRADARVSAGVAGDAAAEVVPPHLFRRDDEDPTEYQRLVDLAKAENDALLLAERTAEVARLRAALEQIERWELPPSGMFYPDAVTGSPTDRPAPYDSAFAHGANGGREAIRAIARAALEPKP